MANLSTYYPLPIVAGTTAGTFAAGDSAAHVGLANTYSANQTLNGTNNVAPNQTAASGSSLMTRDLVRTYHREIITPFYWDSPPNWYASGTALGGAVFAPGRAMNTSSTDLGSAAWFDLVGSSLTPINHTNNGAGGSNLNWAAPFALSFLIGRVSNATNTSVDFRITTTTGIPAYTVPNTEVAVGWKLDNITSGSNGDFQAFSANGSTVTYAAKITNQPFWQMIPARCVFNGSTVVFSYYNTTTGWVEIGTVNRPATSAGNYRVRLALINNGVTAQRTDLTLMGSTRVFLTNLT